MRAVLLVLVVAGCSRPVADDAKDREIAALKAKLAAAPAAPHAAPTPPLEPAASPVDQEDPEDALLKGVGKVLLTNATGDDLVAILKAADEDQRKGKFGYVHLKKSSARYEGRHWYFTGKIVEIAEDNGETRARVALDYYGSSVVWVTAKFTTDFVQGDGVDVAGILLGDHTYRSQAGWNITIPSMMARSIQKYGAFRRVQRATKKERG
jgi:hypothetical protein